MLGFAEAADLRLGVYLDARYRISPDGTRAADIPAVRLVAEVGRHFESLTVFGRAGQGDDGRYPLPPEVSLVRLPDYPALRPSAVLRAGLGTAHGVWRGLDQVDAVWVFGPHPFGALVVPLALLRCRAVALGVRQDSRRYFRLRASGPGRAPLLAALGALDEGFRMLSRRLPTVVVGDDLAARYGDRRRPAIVTTFCQLQSDQVLADPPDAGPAPPLRLLTVGRIEPEKNPGLVVQAMAELERRRPGRFRLTWVGSGSREPEVRAAIRAAGLEGSIDLPGYVPFGEELVAMYRSAFAFVHVSRTEGVPQVLFEAMGSALPVVATDVGGVRSALDDGDAALLVPPDDRDALVDAVLRLDDDAVLRAGLRRRGLTRARAATLDVEGRRLARVLGTALARQAPRARPRAVAVAERLGVPRALNALGRPTRLTVLAYHRVVDPERVAPFDEGVRSATPEAFAAQMEWVASCFSVVSLADLRAILAGSARCPRRPLLITFDDGYADNYEHAVPVLRRLGLPAVVFAATGAVDSRRPHWWDALAVELRRVPRGVVDLPLVGPRSMAGTAERRRAHAELRAAMKRVTQEEREAAIARLREMRGPGPEPDGNGLMITWEQAREMVRAGVDVQPHTVSHPILTTLGPEEIRREIRGSVEQLRDRLGTPSWAFAYPNGDWDLRVVEAVRQEGLELAFTMRPGPIGLADARRRPLEIPRIGIEAADDRAAFRLKAAGVLPLVLSARRALARA